MTKDVELWAAGAGTLRRRNGERTRDGRTRRRKSVSKPRSGRDRQQPNEQKCRSGAVAASSAFRHRHVDTPRRCPSLGLLRAYCAWKTAVDRTKLLWSSLYQTFTLTTILNSSPIVIQMRKEGKWHIVLKLNGNWDNVKDTSTSNASKQ